MYDNILSRGQSEKWHHWLGSGMHGISLEGSRSQFTRVQNAWIKCILVKKGAWTKKQLLLSRENRSSTSSFEFYGLETHAQSFPPQCVAGVVISDNQTQARAIKGCSCVRTLLRKLWRFYALRNGTKMLLKAENDFFIKYVLSECLLFRTRCNLICAKKVILIAFVGDQINTAWAWSLLTIVPKIPWE